METVCEMKEEEGAHTHHHHHAVEEPSVGRRFFGIIELSDQYKSPLRKDNNNSNNEKNTSINRNRDTSKNNNSSNNDESSLNHHKRVSYVGQVQDGLPHGRGREHYPERNCRYIGDFVHGVRLGKKGRIEEDEIIEEGDKGEGEEEENDEGKRTLKSSSLPFTSAASCRFQRMLEAESTVLLGVGDYNNDNNIDYFNNRDDDSSRGDNNSNSNTNKKKKFTVSTHTDRVIGPRHVYPPVLWQPHHQGSSGATCTYAIPASSDDDDEEERSIYDDAVVAVTAAVEQKKKERIEKDKNNKNNNKKRFLFYRGGFQGGEPHGSGKQWWKRPLAVEGVGVAPPAISTNKRSSARRGDVACIYAGFFELGVPHNTGAFIYNFPSNDGTSVFQRARFGKFSDGFMTMGVEQVPLVAPSYYWTAMMDTTCADADTDTDTAAAEHNATRRRVGGHNDMAANSSRGGDWYRSFYCCSSSSSNNSGGSTKFSTHRRVCGEHYLGAFVTDIRHQNGKWCRTYTLPFPLPPLAPCSHPPSVSLSSSSSSSSPAATVSPCLASTYCGHYNLGVPCGVGTQTLRLTTREDVDVAFPPLTFTTASQRAHNNNINNNATQQTAGTNKSVAAAAIPRKDDFWDQERIVEEEEDITDECHHHHNEEGNNKHSSPPYRRRRECPNGDRYASIERWHEKRSLYGRHRVLFGYCGHFGLGDGGAAATTKEEENNDNSHDESGDEHEHDDALKCNQNDTTATAAANNNTTNDTNTTNNNAANNFSDVTGTSIHDNGLRDGLGISIEDMRYTHYCHDRRRNYAFYDYRSVVSLLREQDDDTADAVTGGGANNTLLLSPLTSPHHFGGVLAEIPNVLPARRERPPQQGNGIIRRRWPLLLYDGQWKAGRWHGFGRITTRAEFNYHDDDQYEQRNKHDDGDTNNYDDANIFYVEAADEESYAGQFQYGLQHGFGRYQTWNDRNFYAYHGQWAYGRRHGGDDDDDECVERFGVAQYCVDADGTLPPPIIRCLEESNSNNTGPNHKKEEEEEEDEKSDGEGGQKNEKGRTNAQRGGSGEEEQEGAGGGEDEEDDNADDTDGIPTDLVVQFVGRFKHDQRHGRGYVTDYTTNTTTEGNWVCGLMHGPFTVKKWPTEAQQKRHDAQQQQRLQQEQQQEQQSSTTISPATTTTDKAATVVPTWWKVVGRFEYRMGMLVERKEKEKEEEDLLLYRDIPNTLKAGRLYYGALPLPPQEQLQQPLLSSLPKQQHDQKEEVVGNTTADVVSAALATTAASSSSTTTATSADANSPPTFYTTIIVYEDNEEEMEEEDTCNNNNNNSTHHTRRRSTRRGRVYQGEMCCDRRHGCGIEYDLATGIVLAMGTWRNGILHGRVDRCVVATVHVSDAFDPSSCDAEGAGLCGYGGNSSNSLLHPFAADVSEFIAARRGDAALSQEKAVPSHPPSSSQPSLTSSSSGALLLRCLVYQGEVRNGLAFKEGELRLEVTRVGEGECMEGGGGSAAVVVYRGAWRGGMRSGYGSGYLHLPSLPPQPSQPSPQSDSQRATHALDHNDANSSSSYIFYTGHWLNNAFHGHNGYLERGWGGSLPQNTESEEGSSGGNVDVPPHGAKRRSTRRTSKEKEEVPLLPAPPRMRHTFYYCGPWRSGKPHGEGGMEQYVPPPPNALLPTTTSSLAAGPTTAAANSARDAPAAAAAARMTTATTTAAAATTTTTTTSTTTTPPPLPAAVVGFTYMGPYADGWRHTSTTTTTTGNSIYHSSSSSSTVGSMIFHHTCAPAGGREASSSLFSALLASSSRGNSRGAVPVVPTPFPPPPTLSTASMLATSSRTITAAATTPTSVPATAATTTANSPRTHRRAGTHNTLPPLLIPFSLYEGPWACGKRHSTTPPPPPNPFMALLFGATHSNNRNHFGRYHTPHFEYYGPFRQDTFHAMNGGATWAASSLSRLTHRHINSLRISQFIDDPDGVRHGGPPIDIRYHGPFINGKMTASNATFHWGRQMFVGPVYSGMRHCFKGKPQQQQQDQHQQDPQQGQQECSTPRLNENINIYDNTNRDFDLGTMQYIRGSRRELQPQPQQQQQRPPRNPFAANEEEEDVAVDECKGLWRRDKLVWMAPEPSAPAAASVAHTTTTTTCTSGGGGGEISANREGGINKEDDDPSLRPRTSTPDEILKSRPPWLAQLFSSSTSHLLVAPPPPPAVPANAPAPANAPDAPPAVAIDISPPATNTPTTTAPSAVDVAAAENAVAAATVLPVVASASATAAAAVSAAVLPVHQDPQHDPSAPGGDSSNSNDGATTAATNLLHRTPPRHGGADREQQVNEREQEEGREEVEENRNIENTVEDLNAFVEMMRATMAGMLADHRDDAHRQSFRSPIWRVAAPSQPPPLPAAASAFSTTTTTTHNTSAAAAGDEDAESTSHESSSDCPVCLESLFDFTPFVDTDVVARLRCRRGASSSPSSISTLSPAADTAAAPRIGTSGAGCVVRFGGPVAMVAGCGHQFHEHCLQQWVLPNGSLTCPMCRCPAV